MLAVAEQAPGDTDGRRLVTERLDGRAGGDAAVERQLHRLAAGRAGRAGERGFEIAADHGGREACTLRARRRDGGLLGQLHHLEGARPVCEALDEPALLQSADQTMDTRLRLELERFLHLLEGGRHAGVGEAPIYEEQEFVLLLRKHGSQSPRWSRRQVRTRHKIGEQNNNRAAF